MKKPILVTGIHKSGTTWVGKILAESKEVGYVYEPFNYGTDRKSPVKYWYQYIADNVAEAKEFDDYMQVYLQFSVKHLVTDLARQINSATEVYRTLRTNANLIMSKRQLVKDPIAVLSAEWLAQRYDMYVVMLIRHPAAFVASAKKRDYNFPFEHLLSQKELMDRFLYPYEEEIRKFAAEKQDAISQAMVLWKLIYHVVNCYRELHPEWVYLRNEDLSLNPQKEFENLYQALDLELTDKIKNVIYESSTSDVNTHTKRDSKKNIGYWKKVLTPEEIDRVYENVHEVSAHFYDHSDW